MENKQRKKSALDRFIAWLLMVLQNSFIGRFFTSYDKVNDKFQTSIRKKSKKGERKLARLIEHSGVASFIPKIYLFLMRIPLRDYGIMMLMTGAVVTILYPINDMILFINVTFKMFVLGASTCVCAIPLLFSSRSLADNALSSRLFKFILFDFLGVDDSGFREASEAGRVSFASFAFLIGAVLGVVSYFLMPTYTVLILIGIALMYCTVRTPEVGAVISILAIPFVDVLYICAFVAYTFLCYVLKAIRGKRVFKFEYFDLWVTIAIFVFTVCGINYADPLSSLKDIALNLAIMLSYFMFSNLIHSKVWFRRSIVAFTSSSLVVGIVAIVQSILRQISRSVDGFEAVMPKDADISSTLGLPSVLMRFMVIAIPFAVVHMISEKKDITRFGGFLLSVVLIAALLLSGAPLGLLGFLMGLLLVLVFFKRTAIYALVLVAVALPVLYVTLPDSAIEFVFSFGPLEGASVEAGLSYFADNFIEVIKLPFGVGAHGTTVSEAFGQEYINSLPLQIVASYGVFGFLAFTLLIIMFARVILSYAAKAKNEYRRVNGCAGLCSILAILSVGVFDFAWYDKRIFLLMIITIALSMAYVKIDKEEETVETGYIDIAKASIDIPLRELAVRANAAQRRYVHAPRMKKKLGMANKNKDEEVKEFSNTEELFIRTIRNQTDENEQDE